LNVPAYHWYFALLDFSLLFSALFLGGNIAGALRQGPLRSLGALDPVGAFVLCTGVVWIYGVSGLPESKDSGNGHYEAAAGLINSLSLPPGALAAVEVGTLGYLVNRPVLDITGLTSDNPELISGKHNDVFFRKNPAIVILHDPVWLFERALFDDSRFEFLYGAGSSISVPHTPLKYYLRKEGLDAADQVALEAFIRSSYPAPEKSNLMAEKKTVRGGRCAIDTINGRMAGGRKSHKSAVPPSGLLTVSGWALDPREAGIAGRTMFLLTRETGETFALPVTRLVREDVARHLKLPDFKLAGFESRASLLDFPAGTYSFGVYLEGHARRLVCEPGGRLSWKGFPG